MENYEKLGVFYLGRYRDGETGESTAQPFLYDSRDLLTHAVCVGMTGSGKTGLCLGLLEEAAIDGIPALIVDPKGDLGNLLLTFPNLAPDDFLPWVDAEEAQRKGMSREELAAATAKRWAEGLAKWDQSGERIARLREAAEFAIYTPGSDAGRPLSVLSSFAALLGRRRGRRSSASGSPPPRRVRLARRDQRGSAADGAHPPPRSSRRRAEGRTTTCNAALPPPTRRALDIETFPP